MNDFEKLNYFLAEKNQILVVSLGGALIRVNLPALEACLTEVEKHEFKLLVLSFQDVSLIDMFALPVLARIQKMIRAKPAALRMCALNPEQKALLTERGLLRPDELSVSLVEALKSGAKAA